jgi:parallel beta-helix repeat protein
MLGELSLLQRDLFFPFEASLQRREDNMSEKRSLEIGLIIAFGLLFLFFAVEGEAQVVVDCSTQKLQDAIGSGDTIQVSGTCKENIFVGGSGITLDGGGGATIEGADANFNTVEVKGRNITIRGFTITGGKVGIFVYRDDYALIEDNTIENTGGHGIELRNTTQTKIINNTIRNNPEDGIYVADNSFARIGFSFPTDSVASPNVIEDNGGNGITVTRLSSARIVGNTVRGNGGNGVAVERVSQADISANTINGNDQNGIFVTQNSGGNLGNDRGTGIYDSPNITTAKNINWGIKGTIGAYVDGRRGSLNGLSGVISVDSKSMNKTIP